MLTDADLLTLVQAVPFARDTPIGLALCYGDGTLSKTAFGHWPDGRTVSPDHPFYGASLAKQVTGAALAVLVTQGAVHTSDPVSRHLPDLPHWMAEVNLDHLLHHTAGLPAAGVAESAEPTSDWTTERAIRAVQLAAPTGPPGTSFVYSNLGYICLARVIEHVSGMTFAQFVSHFLFEPLALNGMLFPSGDTPLEFSQAAMMGSSRPLSHGDGGLWTSAPAFAQWLDCQNRDVLNTAKYVEQPGRLLSGEIVGYGWGLGLRRHKDAPLFIHGGSWDGACAKAVRSRAANVSIAAFAASSAEQANIGDLVDTILAQCA